MTRHPDDNLPTSRPGHPGKANRLQWVDGFLSALGDGLSVTESAKTVGISRASVYKHRKHDAGFADAMAQAQAQAQVIRDTDNRDKALDLESFAWDRARSNDAMLRFMLSAHLPGTYDRARSVNHRVVGGVEYRISFSLPQNIAHHTIDAVDNLSSGLDSGGVLVPSLKNERGALPPPGQETEQE